MVKSNKIVTFREATMDDVDLLNYWDTQEQVIAASGNEEEVEGWGWDELIAKQYDWLQVIICEVEGKPIGVLQIIDPKLEKDKYWGEVESNLRALDIWIGEKEELNKGYGTQMMHYALGVCFENTEVKAVLIDPLESNAAAIRFYQRVGFEFLENRVFGQDHCAVHIFKRDKWEKF